MIEKAKRILSLTVAILIIILQISTSAVAEIGGTGEIDALGEIVPAEESMQDNNPNDTTRTITAFSKLDAEITVQILAIGEDTSLLILPDSIEAEVDGVWETLDITWRCDEFDPYVNDIYYFAVVLPDGFDVLDNSILPRIIVKVSSLVACITTSVGLSEKSKLMQVLR